MTVTDAHGLEEAGQHGGGGTGLPDPMHQFEIKRLVELDVFGVDASFTNSGLFMVIAAVLITLFTLIAMRRRALVPGRLQSVAEVSYEFVANMVRDNVGTDGMKYFPFIFTLFMFVLALNMLGMVPYSFTVTSHIIVTFGLAAFIFIGVTLIGFWKHGIKFLKFFVPSGVPFIMLPLLVVILLCGWAVLGIFVALTSEKRLHIVSLDEHDVGSGLFFLLLLSCVGLGSSAGETKEDQGEC